GATRGPTPIAPGIPVGPPIDAWPGIGDPPPTPPPRTPPWPIELPTPVDPGGGPMPVEPYAVPSPRPRFPPLRLAAPIAPGGGGIGNPFCTGSKLPLPPGRPIMPGCPVPPPMTFGPIPFVTGRVTLEGSYSVLDAFRHGCRSSLSSEK